MRKTLWIIAEQLKCVRIYLLGKKSRRACMLYHRFKYFNSASEFSALNEIFRQPEITGAKRSFFSGEPVVYVAVTV